MLNIKDLHCNNSLKYDIPVSPYNPINKMIIRNHHVDSNFDWMVYRHAKFWKWNDASNISLLDFSKMKSFYFLDLKDLNNPKFLEWLQERDDGWKCIEKIPYINKTDSNQFDLYDSFWKEYERGESCIDDVLVHPFYDLPGNKLVPKIDYWHSRVKDEQEVVDYIRNSHERYIRFE